MTSTIVFQKGPASSPAAGKDSDSIDATRIQWNLANGTVSIEKGPEVFLAEVVNNPATGVRGRVAVMGYLTFGSLNKSKKDLAHDLLVAWKEEGYNALMGFEGSFSLFMYDEREGKSLVASDIMGSRPLFITETPSLIAIGTSVKALLALRPDTPAIDRAYVWAFIHSASTIADRTSVESIRSFGAGQAFEFTGKGGGTKNQYWNPQFEPDTRRSFKDTAAEMIENLKLTMSELFHGSSAPCLFLSGGLDSRLLAGLCPDNVVGITLCERMNKEVQIAARVAQKCGLKHRLIIRDPEWYPSLMNAASTEYGALWKWNEAGYIPLQQPGVDFDCDVATLGFGFNTYFKGLHLKWPPLWKPDDGKTSLEDRFLELTPMAPKYAKDTAGILKNGVREDCREQFHAAIRAVLARLGPFVSDIPEMWELFWTGDMVRVSEFLNLVCLRGFTSERNVLSSPRMRRFALTVPCEMRSDDALVLEGLRMVGKGLRWISVANSWLPACFPEALHKSALRCRNHARRARSAMLRFRKSDDISSFAGWPRYDRMLVVNQGMRETVENLINDDKALPEDIFDRAALRQMWREHLDGKVDHQHDLVSLMTFGIFHRDQISPRL